MPWALPVLLGDMKRFPKMIDCPRQPRTEGLLGAQDHTANEYKDQGFVLNGSLCNSSPSSIPQTVVVATRPVPTPIPTASSRPTQIFILKCDSAFWGPPTSEVTLAR